MAKIKAVISDIGGVIFPERWDLVLDKVHEINPSIKMQEFKRVFDKNWGPYKIAAIRRRKYWQKIANNLGIDERHNRLLSRAFRNIWSVPNYDMLGMLRWLELRVDVYALSNACHENEEMLYEAVRDGKINFFKKVYMSHKTRKCKPNLEAYTQILKDNNLKAEECIFIDDKERNTAPAEKLGMHTIIYDDFSRVKSELEKLI